jgi:hypothetical protein
MLNRHGSSSVNTDDYVQRINQQVSKAESHLARLKQQLREASPNNNGSSSSKHSQSLSNNNRGSKGSKPRHSSTNIERKRTSNSAVNNAKASSFVTKSSSSKSFNQFDPSIKSNLKGKAKSKHSHVKPRRSNKKTRKNFKPAKFVLRESPADSFTRRTSIQARKEMFGVKYQYCPNKREYFEVIDPASFTSNPSPASAAMPASKANRSKIFKPSFRTFESDSLSEDMLQQQPSLFSSTRWFFHQIVLQRNEGAMHQAPQLNKWLSSSSLRK